MVLPETAVAAVMDFKEEELRKSQMSASHRPLGSVRELRRGGNRAEENISAQAGDTCVRMSTKSKTRVLTAAKGRKKVLERDLQHKTPTTDPVTGGAAGAPRGGKGRGRRGGRGTTKDVKLSHRHHRPQPPAKSQPLPSESPSHPWRGLKQSRERKHQVSSRHHHTHVHPHAIETAAVHSKTGAAQGGNTTTQQVVKGGSSMGISQHKISKATMVNSKVTHRDGKKQGSSLVTLQSSKNDRLVRLPQLRG